MTSGLLTVNELARVEREARRLRAETMRAMIRVVAARLRAPFSASRPAAKAA